jgi:hypothetical protein
MGGGEPLNAALVVAEPDPQKAEAIIRAVASPDEVVKAVAPLTANVLEMFELKPGQFTHWRGRP